MATKSRLTLDYNDREFSVPVIGTACRGRSRFPVFLIGEEHRIAGNPQQIAAFGEAGGRDTATCWVLGTLETTLAINQLWV